MLIICQETLDKIIQDAVSHYPDESCGMLIGEKGQDSVVEFRPCRNVYDEMHARHPETYPRTARTAYLIDAQEQQGIFAEVERNHQEVKAIYHSHTDHDAYFSEEDKLVAAPWGEPSYPGMSYLVVSVWNRQLKEINEFYWDQGQQDFVKRSIQM